MLRELAAMLERYAWELARAISRFNPDFRRLADQWSFFDTHRGMRTKNMGRMGAKENSISQTLSVWWTVLARAREKLRPVENRGEKSRPARSRQGGV